MHVHIYLKWKGVQRKRKNTIFTILTYCIVLQIRRKCVSQSFRPEQIPTKLDRLSALSMSTSLVCGLYVCAYMPQQMLLPSNASCAADGFRINENLVVLSASAYAAAGGGRRWRRGKQEYISKTLNALTGDIESSNKLWCSASDTLLSRDFFSSLLHSGKTNFCALPLAKGATRMRSVGGREGVRRENALWRRHFCTQATQTCGVYIRCEQTLFVIHNNGRGVQKRRVQRHFRSRPKSLSRSY